MRTLLDFTATGRVAEPLASSLQLASKVFSGPRPSDELPRRMHGRRGFSFNAKKMASMEG